MNDSRYTTIDIEGLDDVLICLLAILLSEDESLCQKTLVTSLRDYRCFIVFHSPILGLHRPITEHVLLR